jgi:hypothetical protein
MVVSRSTADQVLATLLAHLDEQKARALVDDLLKISGNKSFRETIELLDRALKQGRKDNA